MAAQQGTTTNKEETIMTRQQKIEWTKNASNEELLEQLITFRAENRFGKLDDDIKIVKDEILARMSR